MAEQELIKHTRKLLGIWQTKDNQLIKKTVHTMTEIFIIVFAVSLSIWFHSISEHRHEQSIVKEFLLGIKEDLINDITEMEQDAKGFRRQNAAFSYFSSIGPREKMSADSFGRYKNEIYKITVMFPNNGRYEGFKSSGKLGNIKNIVLQNEITDLYQEKIPLLLASTQHYAGIKAKLTDHVIDHLERQTDTTNNLQEILLTDKANILTQFLSYHEEIMYRYLDCISTSKKIINEINSEYHLSD